MTRYNSCQWLNLYIIMSKMLISAIYILNSNATTIYKFFFEDNINLYFRIHFVNELAKKLKKLINICQ